ncbi:hypothetical protein CP10139811_0835 [Chlamydia ibidis]|uniref:tRNA threonylcarbamoyladenosine biosynthesis protein TsaE n=2 Tax=Chlamydia ibidis TaxID=1405396 RepID=S7KKC8_9CHLA|nr:tRNA (adenosine(37)-N6)-threonylcarbamoyltransferase complex ATPase subunit type 1 TsaE [Chlamydia ibidis]EPP34890.1 hypothetical protein CP10139811_0835 [Chlamydia ibidis]EQM63003.1 hypothetical protein H359_0155 [Chlamydia ibidis 10-1398/6]
MDRYRRVTHSSQETADIGARLGKQLPPGAVLLLFGDYGVGKTEFVRGVAQAFLGETLAQEVASPSFSLLHVYGEQPRRICHYDLYRISPDVEVSLLFQDAEEEDVLCIEWPMDIVCPRFRDVIHIRIENLTANRRQVEIESTSLSISEIFRE